MVTLPTFGQKQEFFPVYFNVSPNRPCFNCWGFVAKVAGWLEDYEWLSEWEILRLLQAHTLEVTNPREGDIISFYRNTIDESGLTHAAFYRENGFVLHKMGQEAICEASLKEAKARYGSMVVFHRIKTKKLTFW